MIAPESRLTPAARGGASMASMRPGHDRPGKWWAEHDVHWGIECFNEAGA